MFYSKIKEKEFLTMKYNDLGGCLKNVSEDKEIVEIFDNLYKKIKYKKNQFYGR